MAPAEFEDSPNGLKLFGPMETGGPFLPRTPFLKFFLVGLVMTDKGRNMDDVMIRFEHVTKVYDGWEAIRDFSLEVRRGEFLTIVGSSGGGKTTLLKMVNGLIRPDGGRILIQGENIAGMDLVRLRRNIGYAIQGVGLFPHMTVWRNITYVPSLQSKTDKERTRRAVRRLMDLVGLDGDLALRYPGELSGGQQQRVGIARALAASPDILLMDEPFGAVDEITRKMLRDEITRLYRELGVTILFVTHDIREALKLGTRVLVMNGGKAAQIGTPAQIRNTPADDFVRELVTL